MFKKVLINALKAHPAPAPELVMASLSELDLVIHVHRDRYYNRYVSGIYELGTGIGDSGTPPLVPIFEAADEAGRPPDRQRRRGVEPGPARPAGGGRLRRRAVAGPGADAADVARRRATGRTGLMSAGALLMTVAGLLVDGRPRRGRRMRPAASACSRPVTAGRRLVAARRLDGDDRCTSSRSPPVSRCCC